jgi:sigma-B regulation protein RsbU (phosphoserine phosphatase)
LKQSANLPDPPGENELIQLLLKKQAELNSLLEITQAINKNSSSSVLFEMLAVILTVHLKIGKFRLLVKEDEFFRCAARFGGEYENEKALQQMCQTLGHLQNIEDLMDHQDDLLNNYDYFVPAMHKNNILAFVLIGDLNTRSEFISNDLSFMQTLISIVIVAVENKKLFKAHTEREHLKRDIELASKVQTMLVPLHLPEDCSVEVGSMYHPNQNVGGDYFDFIRLNDYEFLWCIADVSGKGISAALLMANLQASLRASVAAEPDLAVLITKLNHIVNHNTRGEQFITLFLGKYNQKTREMKFVNAGHNPPVLIMDGNPHFLNKGTTMIGAFDELPFVNVGSVQLLPDSLIFNYTDGLIESADEDIFITNDELIQALKINSHLPVDNLNTNVLEHIKTSRKAKMDSDDITLLAMKIFNILIVLSGCLEIHLR